MTLHATIPDTLAAAVLLAAEAAPRHGEFFLMGRDDASGWGWHLYLADGEIVRFEAFPGVSEALWQAAAAQLQAEAEGVTCH